MNSIGVGDLVWIPDGTINYQPLSIPIRGPGYGLVTKIVARMGASIRADMEYAHQCLTGDSWLQVEMNAETYMVDQKDVKKIDGEQLNG